MTRSFDINHVVNKLSHRSLANLYIIICLRLSRTMENVWTRARIACEQNEKLTQFRRKKHSDRRSGIRVSLIASPGRELDHIHTTTFDVDK